MLLPMQVRDTFQKLTGLELPPLALHAVTKEGERRRETYVLSDGRRVVVSERAKGTRFEEWHVPLAALNALKIVDREGVPWLYLAAGEVSRQIPLAPDQREVATRLVSIRDGAPAPRPPQADPAAPPLPSAFVGFCAAMLAMAHVDGDADREEVAAIERVTRNPDAVARGLAHWEEVGTDTLLQQLADTLSEEQRICLVANLIDLAMADGLLRSAEQRLLRSTCRVLGVPDATRQALQDALLWKNRTSVFR